MKCFILGLDGIEYDFVEAWNLKNLMQTEYGKVEVPIGEEGVPMSPQVWSSFLTGRVENISFPKTPRIYKILVFLWNNFGFFVKYIPFLKRRFQKIGRKVQAGRGQLSLNYKLQNPTILDVVNSKAINFPFINHDDSTFKITYTYAIGELSLDECLESLKHDYIEHKKSIFKAIRENEIELFFAFLHHIDSFQHYAFRRQEIIEEMYEDVDSFAASLKQELTTLYPDSKFIIVSDHGFDLNTGMHSKYAFYSTNIPLDPIPQKITDFYGILTSLVNK
jgi:hypothetical protein